MRFGVAVFAFLDKFELLPTFATQNGHAVSAFKFMIHRTIVAIVFFLVSIVAYLNRSVGIGSFL